MTDSTIHKCFIRAVVSPSSNSDINNRALQALTPRALCTWTMDTTQLRKWKWAHKVQMRVRTCALATYYVLVVLLCFNYKVLWRFLSGKKQQQTTTPHFVKKERHSHKKSVTDSKAYTNVNGMTHYKHSTYTLRAAATFCIAFVCSSSM